MAVLGIGGKVTLKREQAASAQVSTSDYHAQTNSLFVYSQAYWSGDLVTLSCARGLPFDDPAISGSRAACPDGYGIYAGGVWPLGPRNTHLQNDSSNFYAIDDSRLFYTTVSDVGQITSATYYIYRDQLDRISFYANLSDALRGSQSTRVPLYAADFNQITISAAEDSWQIQGSLTSWSLQLTASDIDTTAIGEKFGDAVKSIITGGGTMDFIVERENGFRGSTDLMRLLLMTENGCKCSAEFWMIENRIGSGKILPGGLYYSADLLITSNAINTKIDEIIAGSANFVTTGAISLRVGTN